MSLSLAPVLIFPLSLRGTCRLPSAAKLQETAPKLVAYTALILGAYLTVSARVRLA